MFELVAHDVCKDSRHGGESINESYRRILTDQFGDLSKVPTNILEQTLTLIEQKSLAELKLIGSVKLK